MSSYSLVFISAAMLIYRDYDKVHYIWPLTVIGLFFSGYKYRLQKFADGADSGICLSGVSCSDIAVEYFGFMTLPFMGMIAFGLILAATWLIYTDR
jgi:disulfide bond formation protein DsbB